MEAARPAPLYLKSLADGIYLSVKLQPRASLNEIGDAIGSELKVKVTAPPVDAAANEALLKLLAQELDVGRGKVELVRGQTSRHKTLRISGLNLSEVVSRLDKARDDKR